MAEREFSRRSIAAALTSSVGMAMSVGPVIFATFSLFMLPMVKAFHWGRGQFSLALPIACICAALAGPWVGRLVDRWGAVSVLLPGICAFSLANAALATADGSLAIFYLLFALVGASSAFCASVPYAKVLTGWFDRKRGLVLGVALGVGAGIGSALIPQLMHWVIAHFGWRAARLWLSALILCIALPSVALFLRERSVPRSSAVVEAESATEPAPIAGATATHARSEPAFWIMVVMIFVGTVALAGTVVHLIALLSDKGLPTATATLIYSSYSLANMTGHIAIGALLGRINSPRVGLLAYASAFAGLLVLSLGSSLAVLWTGAILLGFGFGAEVGLGAYWAARYWGLRSYGEIYGFLHAAASVGAAVGPFLMGVTFDLFGSYAHALLVFQAAIGLCLLLNLALAPYAYPVSREPLAVSRHS